MENLFFTSWESLIRTFIICILAYFSLVMMLRISGKRTLSQMKEFDFIVTVALGSTLATVLLSKDVALADGTFALALLISLQYILATASVRSKSFARLISSEPTLVLYRGRFLKDALIKERVTEDEIRSVLRSQGVKSIANIEAVVMESNGTFTVVAEGSLTDPDSPLANVGKEGANPS
ncbi:DUF421 domain-containing protein [Dyadobacter tibetensis]|uniref:DUF421 domain-containing protein n=1 Tax=Dyadobacter tibetensis TaxID=1211851 RepID=UPI00047049E8|nr:YetF domain-containing protein [Dyadobacter tibetensis]